MNLILKLEEEKIYTNMELADCKKLIRKLPNGRLECHVRNNNPDTRYNWYVVKDKNKKYLPKTEIDLAKKLAYKRYLKKKIGELENRLIAIESFMGIASGKGSSYAKKSTNTLVQSNLRRSTCKPNLEIDRLVEMYLHDVDAELKDWCNADYFNWDNHPENLTIISKTGRVVRSRIEAAIDESLSNHNLYYRYENPTILDETTIYPDFTIIHPRTKEQIIWEHFGRFDDAIYTKNNVDKLLKYINNGYYPGINLIITSEAHNKELDLQQIDKIIDLFFE